jgi:hypothetical protein
MYLFTKVLEAGSFSSVSRKTRIPKATLSRKIKDSDKGIEEERIKFLFKPFSEMKEKQCLQDVVDYGQGIRLSCSKELSNSLGGDVSL